MLITAAITYKQLFMPDKHTLNGLCVYLCLGLEFTVLYSSWQNLLEYVLSESLYLTQWLIRMSVAHHGVCTPCVFLSIFVHQVWIIAVYVCVCEWAFKPPAHSIQPLLKEFF